MSVSVCLWACARARAFERSLVSVKFDARVYVINVTENVYMERDVKEAEKKKIGLKFLQECFRGISFPGSMLGSEVRILNNRCQSSQHQAPT